MEAKLRELHGNNEFTKGLLDKHNGEEAWLFGKGPSFDDYDQSGAGELRATINEALYAVDSVTYAFCWVGDKKDLRAEEGTIIIDGSRSAYSSEFDKWKPKKEPMFINNSTGELAVSYLIWMGISKLHLIGFDSIGKYSKNFKWTRKRDDMPLCDAARLESKQRMQTMLDMASIEWKDYS